MDYGRWSDRIWTKKSRNSRMKRLRERQIVPIDHKKVETSRFRSFIKSVFRGRVKT